MQKLLQISRTFFKGKFPIHLKNVFGFDIYQINNDIDYTNFVGSSFENPPWSKDGRIFYYMKIFLSSGDSSIDVGANIGLMSLYMSRICGAAGRVVSIEPGPVASAILKRNLFVNGALTSNTILINAVATDYCGSIPLFVCATGESDNQAHKGLAEYDFRGETNRLKVEVKAVTLDQIISEENLEIDSIKFVKIDTQGHEWYVLRGGLNLFSQSKDIAVLCEYCPYLKSWEEINTSDFYDLLKNLGFETYDSNNLVHGEIDLRYLAENFGFEMVGKYTDLLLVKGSSAQKIREKISALKGE